MELPTSLPMDPDANGVSDSGWAVSDIERSAVVRTIYGLIATIGITGNLLIIFVLIRIPALRNRTSQFMIHLASTDLLTCIWIIPFNLFPGAPRLPDGIAGELICRLFINKFPLWATIFGSVYSLCTVHLERYVAIAYPTKYKSMFTPSRSGLIMAACWTIGIISNSYFWVIFDNDEGKCHLVPYKSLAVQRLIGIFTISVVYIIPISFNLYAHQRMITLLRDQAAALQKKKIKVSGIEIAPGAKAVRKRETWQLKTAQELSRTLFVVVITFAICWAPNQITFFAHNMGATIRFNKPPYHITVIMALCNSCLNPFIYFFKNKHYRRGLMKSLAPVLCCRKMRHRWDSVKAGPSNNSTNSKDSNSISIVSRDNSFQNNL